MTFGRLARLILLMSVLLLFGCLVGRPQPLLLQDAVIDGEAVWRGEVRIHGVVTVKKSGRLIILPGTRVLFERIDRDGDGIGDSELLVEGALLARGTAEAPILFSSAERQPQKADWKFLYLNYAREALVEHIVSEYAFSGIQVHFCRAKVLNSTFRHNVDGVRFSTVNIKVAGNRIHDNTHGLRYEERRSSAHVHHNEIRDNDIGIFVVTRSDDRALFEFNNVVDSRQYHVKIGIEQPGDVTFPRNWWGSRSSAAIGDTFFDGKFDDALGRVHAPEFLDEPVIIETWQQQGDPS